MSTMGTIERAEQFIWLNARLLERQLFAHLFRGASREPALAALRAYQNADGGFGNALEPDKRCPASQPIDVEIALRVLDDLGLDDALARRACDWLTTITTAEGGVPFALPSIRDYPRAPWWDAPDDPPASLNPTASIAGLLHKHGFRHPWLERATAYCWEAIAASPLAEVHELLCILLFLQYAPDRPRAERELERVGQRLVAGGLVELDPEATGYVKKPLEWAPAPDSPARRLFADEVVAAHLDKLAAEQREDGGWPISWPPLSAAVELEFRGWVTVQTLKTLRAYGRLPA
jgi:hypothetical protein